MQNKRLSDIKEPELWRLSKTDDIILTKKDSNEKRVLVNYKTYKAIKEKLAGQLDFENNLHPSDSLDIDPFLLDFIDILGN